MEGVGARLGRSSTRYGPTTVFTGPVRKWKKKWIHVSASSAVNHTSQVNGNNGSHLLLYKWAPISKGSNGNNGEKSLNNDDGAAATAAELEEPPRKKFRYVPIAVLEEQKEEAEKADDEAKPAEDPYSAATSKVDGADGKPDINDVPMEEAQAEQDKPAPEDLNETSLDLSLGLKGHDEEKDPDLKQDHSKERQ